MCGIVGVVGNPNAIEIVLEGLKRLEYRGYDSAGLAAITGDGSLAIRKASGKLSALVNEVENKPTGPVSTAIGHTRWATHGAPTAANAHPHAAQFGGHTLAVVHNGIIENYQELRAELGKKGAKFVSDTDTETIPYAIANAMAAKSGMAQATTKAAHTFHGNYAFVAVEQNKPDELTATRRGAPLCIGLGMHMPYPANYVASDPLALAGLTDRFVFLEEGDVARLTPTTCTITDEAGKSVEREVRTMDISAEAAGKQGHPHFMLKEMHEQPAVVSRILSTYTARNLAALPLGKCNLKSATAVNIVACGTAYYAGMVGKYYLETLAGLPVNVDVASEFRYRNPPLPAKGGIFIAVSQSGETADTLAALQYAKKHGQFILALTNVPTSSIARAADAVVNLEAGREIAVASTKAFTAMVTVFALLGLQSAYLRSTLSSQQVGKHLTDLKLLPNHLENTLNLSKSLHAIAEKQVVNAHSMLYLGRGNLAPLAFEGALKMKEISYIHAEAYASGEMKHGPIALVDENLPVLNLAPSTDPLFEKTISNLKEIEARKGRVILFTDAEGEQKLDAKTKANSSVLVLPTVSTLLAPLVYTIPLQLLAYHTALLKGTDVDQPRNLAKSVTVE